MAAINKTNNKKSPKGFRLTLPQCRIALRAHQNQYHCTLTGAVESRQANRVKWAKSARCNQFNSPLEQWDELKTRSASQEKQKINCRFIHVISILYVC